MGGVPCSHAGRAMSRFRYSAACKVEAVRRVVEDGFRVCDVACALGVSEGSLFFWVRRYRQFARREHARSAGMLPRAPRPAVASPRDTGSLVAWLRHADAAVAPSRNPPIPAKQPHMPRT